MNLKELQTKAINVDKLAYIVGEGKQLTVFQRQGIYNWAKQFEETVKSELNREYERQYKADLGRAVDCFIIAIAFVLHFNEKTKFGKKRLFDVLRDIQATVEMFSKREYSPKDYEQMLRDDGIDINVKFKE